MTTSKKIKISDLDFDRIKGNLKNYLKGQSEFTDYDFEGSSLSTLLDVLAYNTHYNSYYLNMIFNELFIDTAVKRSNIVSRAKELGYTPFSCKAATAVVDIIVDTGINTPEYLSLIRGTANIPGHIFTGYDSNQNPYYFVPVKSYIAAKSPTLPGNQYVFSSVELKEGKILSYRYDYNAVTNPSGIFELPVDDVDLSSLVVTVKENEGSAVALTYQRADTIEEVNSDSLVYFLQENEYGLFELYFGNDVIGRKLENGNVIELEYLSTNKALANGIKSFFLDNIGSYNVKIIPRSAAFGGSEKESNDQIRFNAPKQYLARNRAVTTLDYETLIRGEFSDVEDVKVWGGEDNYPKRYGYVYVSMKPNDAYNYPISYLNNIVKTFLDRKKILTTNIEFVAPEYLYVTVITKVTYDQNKTTFSQDDIKYTVSSQLKNQFFNYQLEKFNTYFYHSKLVKFIDDLSPAFLSNLTTVKIQKRLYPTIGEKHNYTVNFWNPLVPESIRSTSFMDNRFSTTKKAYLADTQVSDELGILSFYDATFNAKVYDIGTVNYKTGVIKIEGLSVNDTYMTPETIYIDATPVEFDIYTSQNCIITYNNSVQNSDIGLNSGVTVTVVPK